jgi:uncharacterized Ntn-hydrolase superfamily protein
MRVAVFVGLMVLPSSALATYSVAATDSATKQVGGAITSCVGTLDVGVVYGGVPGHGVVHAQAALDPQRKGKNMAIQMLGMDADPAAIITAITQQSFDNGYASRQYGIVDLQGRSKGYTGPNAQNYKEDRQSTFGTFAYSAQGNILTSKACLDGAEAGFKGNGCDLADRWMLALEGGALNGEGDSRCTPNGIPANSAYIEVDEATGMAGSYLKLTVTNTSPMSAVIALRAKFDAWRMTHACPSVMPDAGTGPDSSTTTDASMPNDASMPGDGGTGGMAATGCSCDAGNGRNGGPSALAFAAVGAIVRRFGRRRDRR